MPATSSYLSHLNKILFSCFTVAMVSQILFFRGLALDGAHNLMRMILRDSFYQLEIARTSFYFLQQLPAFLFIKLKFSNSISLLTQVFSFGLVWIHLVSFIGIWFILPYNKKQLIFFPLLAFFLGPITAFGASISASLSVCSYLWFQAFTIYYSDLSLKKHQIILALSPLPLFLSHELMSYMAWPLIAFSVLKLKSEKQLLNRFILMAVSGCFVVISFTSLFLFFFPNLSELPNRKEFIESFLKMEFFFKMKQGNLQWIYPACGLSFFLLLVPFLQMLTPKKSYKPALFCVFAGLFSACVLSIIHPFYELFDVFKLTTEEEARVWVACIALPCSFLLWWLFETGKLKWRQSFLIASLVAAISLTTWRVGSDYQFYRYQKQFSNKLENFKGLISWQDFKDDHLEKEFIKPFYLVPYSLLFPKKNSITALVVSDKKLYTEQCPESMCQYPNLNSLSQSWLFNLDHSLTTISDNSSSKP